eukprot:5717631-Pyramimonas_sp.AAC.1
MGSCCARAYFIDPNAAPWEEQLTENEYDQAKLQSRLARGKPASYTSEEDDQEEADEDEADEMAQEVDPAEEASKGTPRTTPITDVACDADAPIDPECAVAAGMDLSRERRDCLPCWRCRLAHDQNRSEA